MKEEAQQIIKAIQANDAELLSTLLKAFVGQCEMEDEEPEAEAEGMKSEMAAGNKKAIPA